MGKKQRKNSNVYRVWDVDAEEYLTLGGYTKKASWRTRSGAVAAAEYHDKERRREGSPCRLEVHEFPVQQVPSARWPVGNTVGS